MYRWLLLLLWFISQNLISVSSYSSSWRAHGISAIEGEFLVLYSSCEIRRRPGAQPTSLNTPSSLDYKGLSIHINATDPLQLRMEMQTRNSDKETKSYRSVWNNYSDEMGYVVAVGNQNFLWYQELTDKMQWHFQVDRLGFDDYQFTEVKSTSNQTQTCTYMLERV